MDQRNSIKNQIAIFNVKAFLREVKRLVNKVEVSVCHLALSCDFGLKKWITTTGKVIFLQISCKLMGKK